jgi:quercetin dioxygenase-like cupin family protein
VLDSRTDARHTPLRVTIPYRYRATVTLVMLLVLTAGTGARAAEPPTAPELPQQSERPGISPEVLLRTDVPGTPGKVLIVSRTTYQPGARLGKHYHTGQIVFYVLSGSMICQEEGKNPVTLNPGDTLLIKPGTVHSHWNPSSTEPLVFLEYLLLEEGQRSAIFVKE